MGKVGIFDAAQQKWHTFDDDTEVLIEFLPKDVIVGIQRKGAKQAKLSGGDVDVITNRLIGEAAVKGWRHKTNHSHPGFITPKKVPVPFTPDNRDLFMKSWREFSNFVNEVAIDSKEYLDADEPSVGEEIAAAKND